MSVSTNASPAVTRDADADFAVWSSDQTPMVIRYARSVFEMICAEAVDRFLAIPRGGLEIGGVLFGSIDGDLVTVLARRPLDVEYLTGPGFVLSSNDEEKLTLLLETHASDAELETLRPVGWYHSHTRSDIFLSAEDLAVHQKFFPELQQVALVVRPVKFQPTRAGFFVREPDGGIRSEATYCEFVLDSAREPALPVPERSPELPALQAVPEENDSIALPRPMHRPFSRKVFATAASLAVVAALIAGLLLFERSPTPAVADVRLDLRLTGSGDDVFINWNQASKEVRDSSRGTLEIVDGAASKIVVPLDEASLSKGSVTYARLSESVEVRLRLFSDQSVVNESVAHYVKPLAPKITAVAESPEVLAPADPPKEMPFEEQERARIVEPVRKAKLPPARVPSSSAELTRAIPAIDVAPHVAVPNNAHTPVFSSQLAVPKPPLPKPPDKPKALASGRAIWTGELGRGGVLMINAGRASIGALSGSMPSGPVRIAAHPAELIDGGIAVYTSSPQQAEPPSARNGWNTTMYRNDARRLRDLQVMESPSAANSWRLVLRSEGRSIGLIVLDWQELRQ